ncbi:hypothetical protein FRC10_008765 [Ceratobasidium sp. 414]|nr:hypothetical protein FRC10_008765 [Ceratobasidium sp. 414]
MSQHIPFVLTNINHAPAVGISLVLLTPKKARLSTQRRVSVASNVARAAPTKISPTLTEYASSILLVNTPIGLRKTLCPIYRRWDMLRFPSRLYPVSFVTNGTSVTMSTATLGDFTSDATPLLLCPRLMQRSDRLSRHVFHGEVASAPTAGLEDERYRLIPIELEYQPVPPEPYFFDGSFVYPAPVEPDYQEAVPQFVAELYREHEWTN